MSISGQSFQVRDAHIWFIQDNWVLVNLDSPWRWFFYLNVTLLILPSQEAQRTPAKRVVSLTCRWAADPGRWGPGIVSSRHRGWGTRSPAHSWPQMLLSTLDTAGCKDFCTRVFTLSLPGRGTDGWSWFPMRVKRIKEKWRNPSARCLKMPPEVLEAPVLVLVLLPKHSSWPWQHQLLCFWITWVCLSLPCP